jgi:hypothetical protein
MPLVLLASLSTDIQNHTGIKSMVALTFLFSILALRAFASLMTVYFLNVSRFALAADNEFFIHDINAPSTKLWIFYEHRYMFLVADA